MTNFLASGHIVRNAATRTVTVGNVPTLVTDFTVAVNDGYDPKTNQPRYTNYWRVSLWRETGAKLAPHLVQGRAVNITGIPTARAWLDQNGKPQAQLEVKEARVELIGKKPGDDIPEEPIPADVIPEEELPFNQ